MTPQALDPLGYLLVLRNDLSRSNGALRARYSYQIADGNRAKSYTFTVLGDAQLATPLGTFEVVKLQRRGRKHRVTTLWCARALGYLPVRIDHTEKDGDIVTILIQELSGLARR